MRLSDIAEARDRGTYLLTAYQSALVVIDPQKAFVDARGSLARTYGAEEIRPNVEALARLVDTIARAREDRIPIVLVRSAYRAGQFTDGCLDRPLSNLCVPHTNVDCEWASGLVVAPTDSILTKSSEDAFTSATCERHLRNLVEQGVRVMYFAGFQLTTCVRATALSSSRTFGAAGVRSVVLTTATGARASSYLVQPQDSRSRVERTHCELIEAGVAVAPGSTDLRHRRSSTSFSGSPAN